MIAKLKQIFITIWAVLGFGLFISLTVFFCVLIWLFRLNNRQVRLGFYYLSKTIMGMVKFISKSFTVIYQEPLPKGPAIIVANHSSILDILCFSCLGLKNIVFIGKSWPFKIPFMGYCIKKAGNLITDGKTSFDNLLKQTKEVFKQDLKLVVFPEGTRSKNGKLSRFHTGAFALAQELNVPIIPVTIKGLGRTIKKGSFLVKPQDIKIIVMKSCYISKEENRLLFARQLKEKMINTMEENK